ncbi:hypothetical protein OQA88_12249 [Cercophora sp. LCS_1]
MAKRILEGLADWEKLKWVAETLKGYIVEAKFPHSVLGSEEIDEFLNLSVKLDYNDAYKIARQLLESGAEQSMDGIKPRQLAVLHDYLLRRDDQFQELGKRIPKQLLGFFLKGYLQNIDPKSRWEGDVTVVAKAVRDELLVIRQRILETRCVSGGYFLIWPEINSTLWGIHARLKEKGSLNKHNLRQPSRKMYKHAIATLEYLVRETQKMDDLADGEYTGASNTFHLAARALSASLVLDDIGGIIDHIDKHLSSPDPNLPQPDPSPNTKLLADRLLDEDSDDSSFYDPLA